VIEVESIDRCRVKLRFFAPTSVKIDREEVRARQKAERPTKIPRCRTPEEVMRQRRENVAAGGCCNRHADRMACDCLERAERGEP